MVLSSLPFFDGVIIYVFIIGVIINIVIFSINNIVIDNWKIFEGEIIYWKFM